MFIFFSKNNFFLTTSITVKLPVGYFLTNWPILEIAFLTFFPLEAPMTQSSYLPHYMIIRRERQCNSEKFVFLLSKIPHFLPFWNVWPQSIFWPQSKLKFSLEINHPVIGQPQLEQQFNLCIFISINFNFSTKNNQSIRLIDFNAVICSHETWTYTLHLLFCCTF